MSEGERSVAGMSETEMSEVETESIAYAICSMSDIASQKARGFTLMRVGEDGTVKPWQILVVRWGRQVFGYVNRCPHDGVNLDWERNQFFDSNGIRLMCGKHGALFELGTGMCLEGPCKGRSLQPVGVTIIENDICVVGVQLQEEEDDEDDEESPEEGTGAGEQQGA